MTRTAVLVLLVKVWLLLAELAGGAYAGVIEFTQDNCPPCERMKPIVQRLNSVGWGIQEINLSRQRDPRSGDGRTPQFIVVDDQTGQVVRRHVGACDERTLIEFMRSEQRNISLSACRVIVDNREDRSLGTGFLIGHIGQASYVLTNWHVVRDGSGTAVAQFTDRALHGMVVATDSKWDFALIECPRIDASPVPLAAELPSRGELVRAGGFGGSQEQWRMIAGEVVSFYGPDQTSNEFDCFEFTGQSRLGDSGGPVLNARNEIAGILFGGDGKGVIASPSIRIAEFCCRAGYVLECQPIFRRQQPARQPAQPPRQNSKVLSVPPQQPPPAPVPKQSACDCKDLERRLACLEKALADGKLRGEKGDKGDKGDKGERGERGPVGEIDYDRLAAAMQKIPVNVVYEDGNGASVRTEKVYLGGELRVPPIHVQNYSRDNRLIDEEKYPVGTPVKLRHGIPSGANDGR